MSIITQFKREIDFTISAATPPFWLADGNSNTWSPLKLSSEIVNCQTNINAIGECVKGSYNDDRNASEKIRELKTKVKGKITQLEKELEKVKGSEKKDLILRITNLKEALLELDVIEKAATEYEFKINKAEPQLTYNSNNDTATVHYDGTIGNLLNELKHAFQFETGKIDYIETKDGEGSSVYSGGLLYDIYDEVETYKRQYAYDGYLKLNVELSSEEVLNAFKTGKIKDSNLGLVEIKKMKKIHARIIVKVAGSYADEGFYKYISKKSLDINSSIKDIRKGNKQRSKLITSLGLDKENRKKPYIEFVKVYTNEKYFIHVKD